MLFRIDSPRRALRAALGAAALLVAGCADRGGPVQPFDTPQLSLEYRADLRSTPAGEVIEFTALVLNRGRTPVIYQAGCGPSSFRIEITDPERRNRLDLCGCPGVACPLCAPSLVSLE